MGTLYYCTAGPVIALFALNQRRIIMFAASIAWIVLVLGLIIPARPSFIRNVLNVALFQGFVLFIHYMQEMGSRRMYTLRAELKVSSSSRWFGRSLLTLRPPLYLIRFNSVPSKKLRSTKGRQWIAREG